jgi:hypothetical protein
MASSNKEYYVPSVPSVRSVPTVRRVPLAPKVMTTSQLARALLRNAKRSPKTDRRRSGNLADWASE